MRIVDQGKARFAAARERWSWLDHGARTVGRYSEAGASAQSNAVTYSAFLSFFPILALSVFVVGIIARVYPNASDNLTTAIDQLIPGVIGTGSGQISLHDVQRFSGLAGIVGLAGVIWAGLGWVSSMRTALVLVFQEPKADQPNWVMGKLQDLLAMAAIGAVLFVSVVVGGYITGFSQNVADHIGLRSGALVWVLTHVVGAGVDVLLVWTVFRLVARPRLPGSALWAGAALGGIGFEVLKILAFLLLAGTKGSPAFQAFGVALILLVWINYVTEVILYAAAWAATAVPASTDPARDVEAVSETPAPSGSGRPLGPEARPAAPSQSPWAFGAVAAGVGAAMGWAAARVSERGQPRSTPRPR